MILKLVVSAVPATILGLMMWDVMTLFEKINQLKHKNHIHEKEIEEKLQWLQDDIKDNRREIVELFRRECKN